MSEAKNSLPTLIGKLITVLTGKFPYPSDIMTAELNVMESIKADEELMQRALDFCDFCWRDVEMNEYAFEKLETIQAALVERLK